MSDAPTHRDPLISLVVGLALIIVGVAVYFAVTAEPKRPTSPAPIESPVVEPEPAPAPEPVEPEPAPAEPVEEPAETAKPELPPFLKIVRPLDQGQAAKLNYQIANGALNIDTINVQRLRVTREELPLSAKSGAPLRIDGQAFRLRPRTGPETHSSTVRLLPRGQRG